MQPSTREILRIAFPVSLEFVVMLGLGLLNQIIVGGLGDVAIAAVGFASSITFILIVTLSAIGNSVGILVARAFGGKQMHDINITTTAAILLSVGGGLFFTAVPAIAPVWLLEVAGGSPAVVAAGAQYLQLISLSLAPTLLAAVLAAVLRSTDHATSPLFATTTSMVTNAALAYALVWGVGPFPQIGIAGAGWATLMTALIKCGILGWQAFAVHHVAAWEMPRDKTEWRRIAPPLFTLAIPMAITELVWTVGIYLYNVVFQRLGDEPLAAAQIAANLENIFIIASIGLLTAATALIGRAVGSNNVADVQAWIQRITRLGLVSGLTFGAIYAATSLLVPNLFSNASTPVQSMAVQAIILNAIAQFIKVRNMIIGAGVLPSGNDLRGVIYGDVTGALLVGIPLAILFTTVFSWGFISVVIARLIDEVAKLAVFEWRLRKVDWHKVTGDHLASVSQSADV